MLGNLGTVNKPATLNSSVCNYNQVSYCTHNRSTSGAVGGLCGHYSLVRRMLEVLPFQTEICVQCGVFDTVTNRI